MYYKGAGAAAEYRTGAEECVVGSAELQGQGLRKCTVKEQGAQQSTVRGRRSVWWGPQHPSVGGGDGATGARPTESDRRQRLKCARLRSTAAIVAAEIASAMG